MFSLIIRQAPDGDTALLSLWHICLVALHYHAVGIALCLVLVAGWSAGAERKVELGYTNQLACGSHRLEHGIYLCLQLRNAGCVLFCIVAAIEGDVHLSTDTIYNRRAVLLIYFLCELDERFELLRRGLQVVVVDEELGICRQILACQLECLDVIVRNVIAPVPVTRAPVECQAIGIILCWSSIILSIAVVISPCSSECSFAEATIHVAAIGDRFVDDFVAERNYILLLQVISHAANPCFHCTFEGSLLLGWSLQYVVHLAAGTGALSCLSVSSQNILDASCCGTLILGKTELDVVYIIGSAYLAEVEDDAVGVIVSRGKGEFAFHPIGTYVEGIVTALRTVCGSILILELQFTCRRSRLGIELDDILLAFLQCIVEGIGTLGFPCVAVALVLQGETLAVVVTCSIFYLCTLLVAAPRAPTTCSAVFKVGSITGKYIVHRIFLLQAKLDIVNGIGSTHLTEVEDDTVHIIIFGNGKLILEGLPVGTYVEGIISTLRTVCASILILELQFSGRRRRLCLELDDVSLVHLQIIIEGIGALGYPGIAVALVLQNEGC